MRICEGAGHNQLHSGFAGRIISGAGREHSRVRTLSRLKQGSISLRSAKRTTLYDAAPI